MQNPSARRAGALTGAAPDVDDRQVCVVGRETEKEQRAVMGRERARPQRADCGSRAELMPVLGTAAGRSRRVPPASQPDEPPRTPGPLDDGVIDADGGRLPHAEDAATCEGQRLEEGLHPARLPEG